MSTIPPTTAATEPRDGDPRPTTGVVIYQEEVVRSRVARRLLAGLRLVLGFTFFWPFLDKMFGLGYATPSARAWINGGTPAQGFMKNAEGPFAELLQEHRRPVGRLALHGRPARHRRRPARRRGPQDRRLDRRAAARS